MSAAKGLSGPAESLGPGGEVVWVQIGASWIHGGAFAGRVQGRVLPTARGDARGRPLLSRRLRSFWPGLQDPPKLIPQLISYRSRNATVSSLRR